MIVLNDQKPSLDAVLEQSGIKGMHWGHRKAQAASLPYLGPTLFPTSEPEHKSHHLATGLIVGVGLTAAVIVLGRRGGIKIPKRAVTKVFTGTIEDAPKVAKTVKKVGDIIDGEVVYTQLTQRGTSAIKALPAGTWKRPIAAISA